MPELCLGVSGWGLRVSGDEFIRNMLAQIYIGHMIMLAQMLLFIPVPSNK